jgi:CHAT domain-containing protein
MVDRQGGGHDGVLWLKDIYSLHLPLSLVVLSGCNTRNAEEDTSQGLTSLAHAFFYAGVQSVVGSLWSVEDMSTRQLMVSFYHHLLLEHMSADDALRAAQLKMLANPHTRFPSAWAAFVVDGWPASYGRPNTLTRTQADIRPPGQR